MVSTGLTPAPASCEEIRRELPRVSSSSFRSSHPKFCDALVSHVCTALTMAGVDGNVAATATPDWSPPNNVVESGISAKFPPTHAEVPDVSHVAFDSLQPEFSR